MSCIKFCRRHRQHDLADSDMSCRRCCWGGKSWRRGAKQEWQPRVRPEPLLSACRCRPCSCAGCAARCVPLVLIPMLGVGVLQGQGAQALVHLTQQRGLDVGNALVVISYMQHQSHTPG
jgi:hypothetical protein